MTITRDLNSLRQRSSAVVAKAIAGLSLLLAASISHSTPGDLDPTFGNGGRVINGAIGNWDVSTTSLAVQADGNLLLGTAPRKWSTNLLLPVWRLKADGSFDSRLAIDRQPQSGFRRFVATLQQFDGHVVAAGEVSQSTDNDLRLVRYRADGTPDPAFGNNGLVAADFGGAIEELRAIAQLPDGRLIVAGRRASGVLHTDDDTVLARFLSDGSPDLTFGFQGIVVVDASRNGRSDGANALVVHPDGRLVVAGSATGNDGRAVFVIVRLNPDGTLDNTFDADGIATVDFPGVQANAMALVLRDGGRLLAAGTAGAAAAWAQVLPNGTLDATFGTGGLTTLKVGSAVSVREGSLVMDPDGSIALAGVTAAGPTSCSYSDPPCDVFVARLTGSGQVDVNFGRRGIALIEVGGSLAGDWGMGPNADFADGARLIRLSDGKLLVAGSGPYSPDEGMSYIVVARLLASGEAPGLLGLGTSWQRVDAGSAVQIAIRRMGGLLGIVSARYSVRNSTSPTPVADGTLTWGDGDASDRLIQLNAPATSARVSVVLSEPAGGATLATARSVVDVVTSPATSMANPPALSATAGSEGGGAIGRNVLLMLASLSAIRATQLRMRRRASAAQ